MQAEVDKNLLEAHSNNDDNCIDFSDDSDGESRDNIVAKQRETIPIMKDLDQDPLFVAMKTSSPEKLKKLQKQRKFKKHVPKPPQYFHDPPMTRQRSKWNRKFSKPSQPILRVKLTRLPVKKSKHLDRRIFNSPNTTQHVVLPVSDVTSSMLSKIAFHAANKQYDSFKGTCCHQCRQKTLDTKSCCRNEKCIGVATAVFAVTAMVNVPPEF